MSYIIVVSFHIFGITIDFVLVVYTQLCYCN